MVERCVLVGGPLCSDYVRGKIAEVLDQDCEIVPLDVGPMTAVATGACRQFGDVPPPVLVHDYGVMVDLLHHKQGVLLLRGDQTSPCTSPTRSLRLRGADGRGVEITVFARKVDPATNSQTYETSTTFHFLPRYQNGEACISVALEADASGAISCRVIDESTQREMRLRSVGQGICRPLGGPPARLRTEEVGLWLMLCWQELQIPSVLSSLLATQGDDSPTPEQIEEYVNAWIGNHLPPGTTAELWHDAVGLAQELLRRAHGLPARPPDFDKTLEAVCGMLQATTSSTADENSMRDLLRLLDDLLIWLVRGYGEHVLTPVLNVSAATDPHSSAKRTLNPLLRLLDAFQGSSEEYETLVKTVSEARNELERHAPQDKALPALVGMLELVGESGSLYSRLRRLGNFVHNCHRSHQA